MSEFDLDPLQKILKPYMYLGRKAKNKLKCGQIGFTLTVKPALFLQKPKHSIFSNKLKLPSQIL